MTITGAQDPMTLDSYQERAAETDREKDPRDEMVPLLGMGGEIGSLIAEYKKKRRADGHAYTGFDDVVVEELGDILWYLAALARKRGVRLSEVAKFNLTKTRARWLRNETGPATSFDDGFPDDQRIPRQFSVEFTSFQDDAGLTRAHMRIFGDALGDAIDDNSHGIDHYRFHDAIHFGFAAALGWSPVLRRLIQHKRGNEPDIDRIEDGARARAVEEAVVALVFEMSKAYSHFDGVTHIDDSILAAAKAVTSGLEVSRRTAADWEHAILTGFTVWRGLSSQGSGVVDVDLDAMTMTLREQGEASAD